MEKVKIFGSGQVAFSANIQLHGLAILLHLFRLQGSHTFFLDYTTQSGYMTEEMLGFQK